MPMGNAKKNFQGPEQQGSFFIIMVDKFIENPY